MSHAERAERVARAVAERGLDALVVGDLVSPGDSSPEAGVDLRWLTGFGGTSGAALVGPGRRDFFTDFRYAERARSELPSEWRVCVIERRLAVEMAAALEGAVGFDDARTSVRVLASMREELTEGAELVEAGGIVATLRRRKEPAEIEAIAAAAQLGDRVLERLATGGLEGRTEREVALDALTALRELGAEAPSFPPIIAAGPNSALPHHEPSERRIGFGELVIVDLGAVLDGYCSDCTRTFATSDPGTEARDLYETVRRAKREAEGALGVGAEGSAVDAVARDLITAAGHGSRFGHGTGHGVGMEVHEPPRLGRASEDVLEAGDVVTVEPGIYVEGRFGVRIEELVAIGPDGARRLTGLDDELLLTG